MDTQSLHVQVAAWFLFSILWFSDSASVSQCQSWLSNSVTFVLLFLSFWGIHWLWVWLPCSGLGSFPVYSFLPFHLHLSGFGVGVPSLSLELSLD